MFLRSGATVLLLHHFTGSHSKHSAKIHIRRLGRPFKSCSIRTANSCKGYHTGDLDKGSPHLQEKFNTKYIFLLKATQLKIPDALKLL